MASTVGSMAVARPAVIPLKKRADEIFQATFREYNFQKVRLKPDQSINLVCYIGGSVFDVFSVGARDHFFEVKAEDEDGKIHVVTTPVEQIAFDIIISKKVNEEPPREIGFKMHSVEKQD